MNRFLLKSALAVLAFNLAGAGSLWAAVNAPLKALSEISAGGSAVQGKYFDGGAPGAPSADAVVPGGSHGLQGPQDPAMDAAREREIQRLLKEPVPAPRLCKEKGADCCGAHQPDGRRTGSYSSWKISFTGWNIFGAVVGALVGAAVGFLVAGPVGAVLGGLGGAALGGYLGGVFR